MTKALKAAIKPLVPQPILAAWKQFRFSLEQAAVRNKPLQDVFNDIYAKGTWRPEGASETFHSGPGSMAEVTAGYEAFVASFIAKDSSIKTLVDIGCGDFQVSQRILGRIGRPVRYIGCDIASLVVEHNQKRFGSQDVSFRVLDVSREEVPAGDIVTVREVFQHLSNATILSALANLKQQFKRAIVTEAVPKVPSAPNRDINSGYRTRDGLHSGVFLELPPFNLKILDKFETEVAGGQTLRTLIVALD